MALDNGGVFIDADITAILSNLSLIIAVLRKEPADVLAGFYQKASSSQHQKLDHVSGVVPDALYPKKIMAGDRQIKRLPSD